MFTRNRVLSGVVACGMAVAVTGCGSGDSVSDDGGTTPAASGNAASYPASFKKMIEDGAKPLDHWTGPLTSPVGVKSKTVVGIPCAKLAEGCVIVTNGVQEAAKVLGWNYKSIDGGGTPDKQSDAITAAVNSGADAIVLSSIDPTATAAAIANARKKGVVVVNSAGGHHNDAVTATGVQHDVNPRFVDQGELAGAFIAVHSGGEAKTMFFQSPEFAVTRQAQEGTEASLKQCTACKSMGTTDWSSSEIGPALGSKAQSALASKPETTYGWVGTDVGATPVIQAAQQPGAKQVKWVSFNGQTQNLKYVKDGLQLADIAIPELWNGWAAVDNVNRLFAGEATHKDDGLPFVLITKDNVDRYVGSKAGYQGDIDFRSKYQELWRTGKTDRSAKPAN